MSALEFLNENKWFLELLIGFGIIACIYRWALFVVEAKRCKRDLKLTIKKYEQEKCDKQSVQKALDEYQSIEIADGFIFFRHDSNPRFPLCPVCYSEGRVLRMLRSGSLNPYSKKAIKFARKYSIPLDEISFLNNHNRGFCCMKCDTHIFISDIDQKSFAAKYGIGFPGE